MRWSRVEVGKDGRKAGREKKSNFLIRFFFLSSMILTCSKINLQLICMSKGSSYGRSIISSRFYTGIIPIFFYIF